MKTDIILFKVVDGRRVKIFEGEREYERSARIESLLDLHLFNVFNSEGVDWDFVHGAPDSGGYERSGQHPLTRNGVVVGSVCYMVTE